MALTPAMFIRVHVLDMSQKSLAAELDVTQPRVSKWESTPGQIPKKHHDTVKKLAAKKKRRLPDSYFTRVPIEGE